MYGILTRSVHVVSEHVGVPVRMRVYQISLHSARAGPSREFTLHLTCLTDVAYGCSGQSWVSYHASYIAARWVSFSRMSPPKD